MKNYEIRMRRTKREKIKKSLDTLELIKSQMQIRLVENLSKMTPSERALVFKNWKKLGEKGEKKVREIESCLLAVA